MSRRVGLGDMHLVVFFLFRDLTSHFILFCPSLTRLVFFLRFFISVFFSNGTAVTVENAGAALYPGFALTDSCRRGQTLCPGQVSRHTLSLRKRLSLCFPTIFWVLLRKLLDFLYFYSHPMTAPPPFSLVECFSSFFTVECSRRNQPFPPNPVRSRGRTPFSLICQNGMVHTVSLLIKRGYVGPHNVEEWCTRESTGETPLVRMAQVSGCSDSTTPRDCDDPGFFFPPELRRRPSFRR
jgi:hypothetical protein